MRDRPTKPPPVKGDSAMKVDCTLMGISAYPDVPAESLEPVVAYVCDEIIPEQIKRQSAADRLGAVACFITREQVSMLWSDVDPSAIGQSPGFVCVLHNIKEDALFYFAASLRADAFVYVFERQSPGEELVFAIWNRLDGVGAFVNRNGKALTQLPSSAVRNVLPASIAAGDRDEDTVH